MSKQSTYAVVLFARFVPVGDGITPQSLDQERRLANASVVWRETAEAIGDTPAITAAGRAAKAQALIFAVNRCVCAQEAESIDEAADVHEWMALSLARDALEGSGAI